MKKKPTKRTRSNKKRTKPVLNVLSPLHPLYGQPRPRLSTYKKEKYCGVRQRKHGIYLLRIWSRKIHCKKWWFHSTLLWSKFGYVFSAYNVRDGGEKMEKSIYEKGMKLLIWGAVISAVLVSIITGFTLEKLLVCTIIGIVGIICWRLR